MSDGAPPSTGPGRPIGANPSFVDLITGGQPVMRPQATGVPSDLAIAHGTTVLGLKYADGVVMAGDRRATEGYSIADDKMDKVFPADDLSAISIAGAAGQAVEIVKLFQLELEHYEKITGDRLSLEGKANRLAQMIRGNLPLAMQGLVVVSTSAHWRAPHASSTSSGLPQVEKNASCAPTASAHQALGGGDDATARAAVVQAGGRQDVIAVDAGTCPAPPRERSSRHRAASAASCRRC